jgi:hypothetical protein
LDGWSGYCLTVARVRLKKQVFFHERSVEK